jgi:hypothetical protein
MPALLKAITGSGVLVEVSDLLRGLFEPRVQHGVI